jgi:hypothetical protein
MATVRIALLDTFLHRRAKGSTNKLLTTRLPVALTPATIEGSHIDIELGHAPSKCVHVRNELVRALPQALAFLD